MKYNITVRTGSETHKATFTDLGDGDYMFHIILSVIDTAIDKAYDTGDSWSVKVSKGDEVIRFYGGTTITTVVNGQNMGEGYHDCYLNGWMC